MRLSRLLLALVAVVAIAAAAIALPIPVYQPVADVPGIALAPQPVGGPFESWGDLVFRDASGNQVSIAARLRYQDGLVDIQLISQGPTPGDIWRRNGSGHVLVYAGETLLNP